MNGTMKLKTTKLKDCIGKTLAGHTSVNNSLLLLVFDDGSLLEITADPGYDGDAYLSTEPWVFVCDYEEKELLASGAINEEQLQLIRAEAAEKERVRQNECEVRERIQYETLKKKFEGQQ